MTKIYIIGLVMLQLLSAGRWAMPENQPPEDEESEWSELRQLSSLEGEATAASMMADEFGFVHAFWAESGFFDHDRSVIQYARFDGEDWTEPATIYASWPTSLITQLSSFVDKQGTLHLVWAEGGNSPLNYTSVAMEDAFSANNWREPILISVEAFAPKMVVDSAGVVHILYVNFFGDQPGIYYVRSENQGKWWSYPQWIDTDLPSGAAPRSISLKLDQSDGMHALWSYVDKANPGVGGWIRYARSFDGGESWSDAFTVDVVDVEEDEEDELRAAGPILAVDGRLVHILWAGNEQLEREYRVSDDAGTTWSDPSPIFGELHGAAGDDMATDSAGRLHFVGQIRFPMAVYHAIWENGVWSEPAIAYFIKENSEDEVEDRIGAHSLRLAIRSGNQLVMTFTTSPADTQAILFEMHRTLEELPAEEPISVPTSTSEPGNTPTAATPEPAPTDQTRLPISDSADVPARSPGSPLLSGLVPVAALIGGVIVIQVIRRR